MGKVKIRMTGNPYNDVDHIVRQVGAANLSPSLRESRCTQDMISHISKYIREHYQPINRGKRLPPEG